MPNRATKTTEIDRGQRLKEIRLWLGITQDDMAEWLIGPGASRVNISQSENNARPVPVERLGELFGVSADWIIGLSDERWGAPVQAIRAHLSSWLRGLSSEQNEDLYHPAERIAASYNEIKRISSLVTERYGAAILGVPVDQFQALLNGDTFVTQHNWERWSEWTGLPLRWIIHGSIPAAQSELEALSDFVPVMEEAKRLGIAPDRLMKLIRVMAEQ